MASLAQTTQTTRTILKWSGIAFAMFLVIRLVLIPLGKPIFYKFFPKEPPPPTMEFGILPKIPFPPGQKLSSTNLALKTTTGSLPTDLPDRLNIYTFVKRQPTFSSYDQVKQKANTLGFTGDGSALSPIQFLWDHPKIKDRQIIFNSITQAFTLKTKMATSSAELLGPPPSPTQAISIAKGFLSVIALLPTDIDDAKTKTTFLKLNGSRLVGTTSLSESDYIQVDFYRKSISKLPIMNPHPNQALLSFRIKRTERESYKHMIEAHYAYRHIDIDGKSSTYPIKTAQEAFNNLKLGKAYVASQTSLQGPIRIERVYLAYYEGDDEVQFLLPIFVFEGEGGFLAFVEAVKEEWLK